MLLKNMVMKSRYLDSVVLMQISAKAGRLKGVRQSSCMMGTPNNLAILREAGLLSEEGAGASPNDVIVAVKAEDDTALAGALNEIEEMLSSFDGRHGSDENYRPRTLRSAVDMLQGASLAVISLPGPYVKDEALKALSLGCNLMIFSDNVPVDHERFIKEQGRERNLLVMGPDCGTAIIQNVALCFANKVRKGSIGIVGAAGTGIQEAACILSRVGAGISHAIGTGGRDLSSAVGGITTLMALDLLEKDPATSAVLIISKPPSPDVEEIVLERVSDFAKPVVVNFLRGDPVKARHRNLRAAETLEEGALLVAELAGIKNPARFLPEEDIIEKALGRKSRLSPEQVFLRGLYSGGTLCDEAQILLERRIGDIYSNVPLKPEYKLKDSRKSQGNCLLDLGDDEFTVGVPHPMLDFTLRCERIMEEARDPEVAVILMDVVLGYGVHPNPAEPIADAVKKAMESAAGRHIIFLAALCGLDGDPQDYQKQKGILEEAGILVACTNASAVRCASAVMGGIR